MSGTAVESKRIEELFLPITFMGWDIDDYGDITYYDVNFTEAFGKWRKDEHAAILILRLSKGLLQEYSNYNNNVNHLKEQKIKITPIEGT